MFDNYRFTVAERFIKYVQIDTQSDPLSNTHPSTEKQKNLGKDFSKGITGNWFEACGTGFLWLCICHYSFQYE